MGEREKWEKLQPHPLFPFSLAAQPKATLPRKLREMARGSQKLAPSLGPAGGSDVRDTTARPRHKLPRNSTFLPSWSGSGGLEKQAGEGPTQIGMQVAPSNLPARPTTATLNPSECHPSNPNPSIPSIPLNRLSNCRRRCQSMPSRLPTCSSLPHSSLQGQMQLLDGVCRPDAVVF